MIYAHLSREIRRTAPMAVLCCCVFLGILYVRAGTRLSEPEAQHWKHRKMESMLTPTGPDVSASRSLQTSDNTTDAQRSARTEADTSGHTAGQLLDVKFQPKPVHWPWEEVEGCSQYGIRFAKRGSLPVVALTSYPGSGNTWTRYLLEMATGVFTGSVYYDISLYGLGYWGEMSSPEDGTTIVQKIHEFGEPDSERFNHTAIVIMRNPYRAVLSFHNYLFGGHTGMAPSKNYLKKGWRKFVMKQIFEWSAHVQQWTDPANRVLVVHYEHLKTDPVAELRRMLHFLRWPVDEARLRCVQADQNRGVQRHVQHRPRDVTPFPADLRRGVDLAIDTIDRRLRRQHRQRLPLAQYEFYNGSSLRTELLEDCQQGEQLDACLYRIDKMNFRYQIKAFFERMRDNIKSTRLGGLIGGAASMLSSTLALVRHENGTSEAVLDARPPPRGVVMTPEEEMLVEKVMRKTGAGRSRRRDDGTRDNVLQKFGGLLGMSAADDEGDELPEIEKERRTFGEERVAKLKL